MNCFCAGLIHVSLALSRRPSSTLWDHASELNAGISTRQFVLLSIGRIRPPPDHVHAFVQTEFTKSCRILFMDSFAPARSARAGLRRSRMELPVLANGFP